MVLLNCINITVIVIIVFTVQLYTVLSGLNYYVLAFKFIIWCNALIMYIHVFTLYLQVITSVINLPIPPDLSLTLPVSHHNISKSVLQ